MALENWLCVSLNSARSALSSSERIEIVMEALDHQVDLGPPGLGEFSGRGRKHLSLICDGNATEMLVAQRYQQGAVTRITTKILLKVAIL